MLLFTCNWVSILLIFFFENLEKKISAMELLHFIIREEPRKLVLKTYKAMVFQHAIDFLQKLSIQGFPG